MKEAVKALVGAFEDDDQVGLSSIPQMTKDMLASVIPTSLGAGAAADERHDYQVKIADAIGVVLKEVVTIWEGKVVEEKNGVTAAEATKTEKVGAAEAATKTLEAKSAATVAAQETLTSAKQALTDAHTNVGKCKDAVDSFDIQLEKKGNELERVKGVHTEHFVPLKGGLALETEKEQKAAEKKHLSGISSLLKLLKADTSLMSALESALTKKPEERGQFDSMAIDQLEKLITEKIDEQQTFINNAESIKAEKAAAVTAAEETLANSEKAKTQGEEDLDAAKKAQKEAGAALKDAEKAVGHAEKAVDKAKETETDAEASLEDAKKHVELFEFLYSRPSKAPEPEPPAVEEAPPAEAPPAEAEPMAAEPEA